jgi:hypothetical protein
MCLKLKENCQNYLCSKTSWFRPSKNNKYDWEDIKKIIKSDALEHNPTLLKDEIKESIRHNNYLLMIFFFIIFILLLIFLSIFFSEVTGVAALLVGLIAIYNATNQILAKVRSENRQKWIDDVRSSLAELITYMYIFDSSCEKENLSAELTPEGKEQKTKLTLEEKNKAEKVRFKLELLMNPSEKDHRTIGYLLRKAYQVKKMELIDSSIETNLRDLLDEIIDMNAPENTACNIKDYDKLISWLIRLSNATLKREWELVKNAK